mgnify:CR=1 FL=1
MCRPILARSKVSSEAVHSRGGNPHTVSETHSVVSKPLHYTIPPRGGFAEEKHSSSHKGAVREAQNDKRYHQPEDFLRENSGRTVDKNRTICK